MDSYTHPGVQCRCGETRLLLRWRQFKDNGAWHIECRCYACRRWIKWLEQTPESMAEAYATTNGPTPDPKALKAQHERQEARHG